MKQKILSLILALSLLPACLTGCGGETVPPAETDAPAPTETDTPTETEAPDAASPALDQELLDRRDRYAPLYEKFDPDAVVMTVDDTPVTWAEYFSWIFNAAIDLESSYGITDWSQEPAYASYLTYYASTNCIQIATILNKADALGVSLTAEQQAAVDEELQTYIDYFGGEDGFKAYLDCYFLPIDYLRLQNRTVSIYNNLYEQTFGAGGEKVPDADVLQYLEDQGYLHAKHILFSTLDDDRKPLPEDEVAKKKAEAESVLAQLRAAKDQELPTLFDSLMQQYCEDPGMLSYPNGYYFQSGEMVAPFEEAAKALEVDQISDIVETDYGFHILFRPAVDPEDTMGYDDSYRPYTPRNFAAKALFNNTAYDWYDAAQVVYMPGFEELDLAALMAE